MSALVQFVSGPNGFGANPYTQAYTSPVVAGNLLVVFYKLFNAAGSGAGITVSSITDSLGNLYTIDVQQSTSSTNYDEILVVVGHAVSIASGANTVTVTAVGISITQYPFISLGEFSGSPIPVAATSNIGNSNTPSAGTVASLSGGVAVAVVSMDDNAGVSGAYTPGAGWTLAENDGAGLASWAIEYQVNTSPGTVTGNLSRLNLGPYAADIVSFSPPQTTSFIDGFISMSY